MPDPCPDPDPELSLAPQSDLQQQRHQLSLHSYTRATGLQTSQVGIMPCILPSKQNGKYGKPSRKQSSLHKESPAEVMLLAFLTLKLPGVGAKWPYL